jgi:hypothetical protein
MFLNPVYANRKISLCIHPDKHANSDDQSVATDAFKALSDAKDVLLERISTKRSAGESSSDCGTDDSDGASTTSKASSSKRSSKSRSSSKRARDTSDDDGVVRNYIVIISRYGIV